MAKYYKSILRGTQYKPKGLKYKPRYYDPEKEKFDATVKEIKMKYADGDQAAAIGRAKTRRNIETNRFRMKSKQANRAQLIRVTMLIGALFAICYKFVMMAN